MKTMKNVFSDVLVPAVVDDHVDVGPCPNLSGFLRFLNDLLGFGDVVVGVAVRDVGGVGFVDHGVSVELGHGICAGSVLTPDLSLGTGIGKGFRNLRFLQTTFPVSVFTRYDLLRFFSTTVPLLDHFFEIGS